MHVSTTLPIVDVHHHEGEAMIDHVPFRGHTLLPVVSLHHYEREARIDCDFHHGYAPAPHRGHASP